MEVYKIMIGNHLLDVCNFYNRAVHLADGWAGTYHEDIDVYMLVNGNDEYILTVEGWNVL